MDLTSEQKRVVYTLGFCGLVSAADNWFVSPVLPAIANALGVATSAATIVLTAYLVPYGLLQPVCGTLGDRFGRLRVLHVIVAGLAAGTFLCAVAFSLVYAAWDIKWWALFITLVVALLLAIPASYYNRRLFSALLSIPHIFLVMLLNVFRLRGANKQFIHTQHGVGQS